MQGAIPCPPEAHPDYPVFLCLRRLLDDGLSSRLPFEVVEKRGLAYAVDAYAETYDDTGVLGIFAGCAASDAAELARVAAGEVQGLAQRVEPGELARARAQLKASMFMARESPLARAEQAAGQVLLFGEPLDTASLGARIDAVEESDLLRLGSQLLAPGLCAVSALGPKAAGKATEAFRRGLFG